MLLKIQRHRQKGKGQTKASRCGKTESLRLCCQAPRAVPHLPPLTCSPPVVCVPSGLASAARHLCCPACVRPWDPPKGSQLWAVGYALQLLRGNSRMPFCCCCASGVETRLQLPLLHFSLVCPDPVRASLALALQYTMQVVLIKSWNGCSNIR